MTPSRASQLIAEFEKKSDEASESCCDFAFHVDVTSWNNEMKELMSVLSLKHGINSFRVFMSDQFQLNDSEVNFFANN